MMSCSSCRCISHRLLSTLHQSDGHKESKEHPIWRKMKKAPLGSFKPLSPPTHLTYISKKIFSSKKDKSSHFFLCFLYCLLCKVTKKMRLYQKFSLVFLVLEEKKKTPCTFFLLLVNFFLTFWLVQISTREKLKVVYVVVFINNLLCNMLVLCSIIINTTKLLCSSD